MVMTWHIGGHHVRKAAAEAHDHLGFPSYLNHINSVLGFIIHLHHPQTSKNPNPNPYWQFWLILGGFGAL